MHHKNNRRRCARRRCARRRCFQKAGGGEYGKILIKEILKRTRYFKL